MSVCPGSKILAADYASIYVRKVITVSIISSCSVAYVRMYTQSMSVL